MALKKRTKLKRPPRIDSFDFLYEETFAGKYEILDKVGQGWEGEVFLLLELATNIERAAKFFYPHRNKNNKAFRFYAKKLHKLRNCPILIQYHTQELLYHEGVPINFLVSEFVEGEKLSDFLLRQPGKRLNPFQALHLLHALAKGIEPIHRLREYHGDLHTDNVLIQRYGLQYKLKVLDFFHWAAPRPENIQDDVCFLIEVFFDALGGRRHYANQPREVKEIICGLKRTLILKKYRTAGQLRQYLENMEFSHPPKRKNR